MSPEQTERQLAETLALRLILGALEESDAASVDTASRVLLEFLGCESCTADVLLVLLQLLINEINRGGHRGDWEHYIDCRLMMLFGWPPSSCEARPINTVTDICWAEGER